MKIWFDITNTPQVHFLLSIKSMFDSSLNNFSFTAREFSETTKLLKEKIGSNFNIVGKHYGKHKIVKAFGLLLRTWEMNNKIHDYDISISCGSENAIWLSKLKNKKSIAFGDNDLAKQWTYSRFVDFSFFPDAIALEILTRQGLKKQNIYLYHGLKEDVYIADYTPDKNFLNKLPFNNYVVVRPENLKANYVNNSATITPELLGKLSSKGFNIVYLPRYEIDFNYSNGIKNIFIPDHPLNGLDLCYFADAVLTGAGTFAREAACLDTPSFSFFAGDKLLSVDKKLISEKKLFFSRNPEELIFKLISSTKHQPDLNKSRIVKKEVRDKLFEVIESFDLT